MIHQLKTKAEYFEAVVNGDKTFEIRCDDRDFHVGDFLALNELTSHKCNDAGEHKPTGRCCLVRITYILNDAEFLRDGYVAIGFTPCEITWCEAHDITRPSKPPVYTEERQGFEE